MGRLSANGTDSLAVLCEGMLGRPCSNNLTSFRLVLFLYHCMRVFSLSVNNTKFVPSSRGWLFKRRALTSL